MHDLLAPLVTASVLIPLTWFASVRIAREPKRAALKCYGRRASDDTGLESWIPNEAAARSKGIAGGGWPANIDRAAVSNQQVTQDNVPSSHIGTRPL